jgi:hypothetical protein
LGGINLEENPIKNVVAISKEFIRNLPQAEDIPFEKAKELITPISKSCERWLQMLPYVRDKS